MINFLISFLILVIVAVVVFYVTKYILDMAEVDPPIRKLVLLVLLVVFLIAILNLVSGGVLWKQPIIIGAEHAPTPDDVMDLRTAYPPQR